MRVALLSANARAGDAIGNQVAEKLAFFLDRGADARVFVESDEHLHPLVRQHYQAIDPAALECDAWAFVAGADLVIVEYGHFYRLLHWLPMLAGGRARILLDYHGVTPANLFGAWNREAVEQAARQRGLVWFADRALTHSRFTKSELLEPTNFPECRTHCLGHPVDMDRFRPGPARRSFHQRLGLTPDVGLELRVPPDPNPPPQGREPARLLLFVGRLAPNKRVPILVEALSRLRDLTPPVHAVIVGDTEDVYELEATRCRELANTLGIGDRLHFLGHVDDETLLDAYRSADVFVMPSLHEGFCIPVVEAMACGLPVVAARAGALPEILGGAGLTFEPDNANELARQVRRILTPHPNPPPQRGRELVLPHPDPCPQGWSEQAPLRVAVVAMHDASAHVGGAETSLMRMASALHEAGHHVEVYTTDAPKVHFGRIDSGLFAHKFPPDRQDLDAYHTAAGVIAEKGHASPGDAESAFLRHSVHSGALQMELQKQIGTFDAVITGPFLSGLAADIASAFPEKTLLVPCFHDEPTARLRVWHSIYGNIGGMLFHSPEEQDFAQWGLGFSVPGSACVGTVVDTNSQGDAQRGRQYVRSDRPYVVYCGRYLKEKEVPLLLDYARRYCETNSERFTFVFLGEGAVPIPSSPWARDLGFVDEETKRDVIACARAIVQLSRHESLSLTALESWAQGVPVVANRHCPVLAGHIERCDGGRKVDSYDSFAAVLGELWTNPERWQERGRRGQEYVRRCYGSPAAFTAHLDQAIRDLKLPLLERIRRRGLARAANFSRPRWRERFAGVVESILHAPALPYREQLEVEPRGHAHRVVQGKSAVLVPVRVWNKGTHPAVADGPARVVLQARVRAVARGTSEYPASAASETQPMIESPLTRLPSLLLPGRNVPAAVTVPVPPQPGTYIATFYATRVERREGERGSAPESQPTGVLRLLVDAGTSAREQTLFATMLDEVRSALAEAQRLQRLPDAYLDVCTGRFASWKRWVKRKLLGNFQRAYVDVLSRQQSAFNQSMLTVLSELTECCATLQSIDRPQERQEPLRSAAEAAARIHELEEQLATVRRQCAALEERLEQLGKETARAHSRRTDRV